MGSRKDCDVQLRNKFAKVLSDKEMDEISKRVFDMVDKARYSGTDVRKMVNDFFTEHKRRVRTSQARRVMTAERYRTLKDQLINDPAFAQDPDKFLESLMHHNHRTKDGFGTLWRTKQALNDDLMSVLLNTLDSEPGLRKRWSNGELSRDVMRLLHDDIVDDAEIDPQAVKVAGAIRKIYDRLYRYKVDAGFMPNYLKGYAGKQIHPAKALQDIGRDKWIELAKKHFDIERMELETAGQVDKELGKVYDGILKRDAQGFGLTDDDFSIILTGGGGSRLEKNRKIHFLSGEDMADYYGALGINYAERVGFDILQDTGQIAAAMQFGPNHRNAFDKLMVDVKERARELKKPLSTSREKFLRRMYEYSVSGDQGDFDHMWARFGNTARKLNDITKLGSAVLTTVTDFAFGAGIRSAVNGRNFLGNFADVLSESTKAFIRPGAEKKVWERLGVFGEDIIMQTTDARFAEIGTTVSSAFDKAHHYFMNATGLPRQSRSIRRAQAKLFAMDMVDYIDAKNFTDIPEGMRQKMGAFGITEDDWKLFKDMDTDEVREGQFIFTPENIRDLPDDGFRGKTVAEKQRHKTRLILAYKGLLQEMAELGAPHAGLKQKAFASMLPPDSFTGQVWRMAMQYKSFALSTMDTMLNIAHTGDYGRFGNVRNVGATMLMGSALGYLVLAAKAKSKGREAPDWNDPETWIESAIQGGTGTMLGDFLLTDYRKNYRSLSADLLGPTASAANDLAYATSAILRGDEARVSRGAKNFVNRHLIPKAPIIGHLLNKKIFELSSGVLNPTQRPLLSR